MDMDVWRGEHMSDGNRFVVEVVGKLREAREVTVSRVCEALGLDEGRAGALVARMPGVITKPVGEDRAMKIALRLQEAGVPALHRPLTEVEAPLEPGETPSATAPAPTMPSPAAEVAEPAEPAHPGDIPSIDATHHDFDDRDPKLTPMSEAGFGAADIMLPTESVLSTQERSRPRATFVEAGSTSTPSPPDDPAVTMVRPARASPTPLPPAMRATPVPSLDAPTPALTPVSPVLTTSPAPLGRGVTPVLPARGGTPVPPGRAGTPVPPGRFGTPVPPGRPATPVPPGRGGASQAPPNGTATPVYRQTKSSAEPPLTLSAPPDEVLQRSGVPEADLASAGRRRRGRFGRHLAAQVALPGLLTWSLTAVALWWFLGEDRPEYFVLLAAATAVTALIGSLVAALGTVGIARDVVRLRDEARRVAMGELTTPVASNRDDELGELAGALERMRLSLQEGLERLRQRNR
jgi:HAMP domain-containing protein